MTAPARAGSRAVRPDPSPGRPGPARAGTTLSLAARFAFGSRAAWVRTVLTALGVGVGVAVLLLAASVPGALAARDARAEARSDETYTTDAPGPGPGTLLIGDASTPLTGRQAGARVRVLHPDGPRPPVPPGLDALPGDREMAVSPALRTLLASPDGRVLAVRLPYRDVATIGDAGLLGPDELVAYAVDRRIAEGGLSRRIDHFGAPFTRDPLDPVLTLVLVVGVAVLALPVGVFVATSARFGGEARDRRLAALRLLGLDSRTVRRVAACEGGCAAVLGLGVGAVLFLAGRQLLRYVSAAGLSVFPSDAVPSLPLGIVVAVAVPAVAVVGSLAGLRSVTIEPLGVSRRARPARRRGWWRVLLVAVGAVLLAWQVTSSTDPRTALDPRVALAGVLVLLLGVLAVQPWLADLAVARLGAGPLPWQLAVRRLQSGGATSGRVAAGVAVALAGVVALQSLFGALAGNYTEATGQDPGRADAFVSSHGLSGASATAVGQSLARSPGVDGVAWTAWAQGRQAGAAEPVTVVVGGCADLEELADLPSCADGDVFTTSPELAALHGGVLRFATTDAGVRAWPVPADAAEAVATPDPLGDVLGGQVLATRGALGLAELAGVRLDAYVRLSAGADATTDLVRVATAVDPVAVVRVLQATTLSSRFAGLQAGLTAGASAVLLAVGATLLVSSVEQLRERAAVLSALSAVGMRRRTVAASLLVEAAVPVCLGLAVALLAGTALGALLALVTGAPAGLPPVGALGLVAGAGAVLLGVSALSLPALGRAMRPVGARVE